ncbi:salivary peroxidase/catechol oxidase-like [Hetaerina americana]|uniref:salivary peroxidase/catechol oxidase-like n=1 Tax=Hetaerina americana TaxID=62018 RepID=UPI003A7F4B01
MNETHSKAKEVLQRAKKRSKEHYDKSANLQLFEVGDKVLLYDERVSKVVKFTTSGRLPSPRTISLEIFKDKNRPQEVNSLSLMQWSQVITHDVGYQEEKTNEDGSSIECCKHGEWHGMEMEGPPEDTCLPILIPKDDPYYSKYGSRCMNFVRSEWTDCNVQPTEDAEETDEDDHSVQQINHVSSFMDLSVIYGDDLEILNKLRLWKNGLLKTRSVHSYPLKNDQHHYKKKREAPEDGGEPENDPPGDGDEDGEDEDDEGAEKKGGKWNFLSSSSSSSSSSSEEIKIGQEFPLLLDEFLDRCRERSSKENVCYLTGDERLNEHPWLASHHVVLIREHNRVARRLSDMHPHWDDERLFQETRRIVTAIFQSITYKDYLPRIVGKKILERMDLVVGAMEPGGGGSYNASVNPSSMSVFSTAAFRYLHTLIEGHIQ